MSAPAASVSDLSQIVESVMNIRVDDLRCISHDNRLYSSIYLLNVETRGESWPLVMKTWSHGRTYRLQKNAIARARRAFEDDDQVVIPFLATDADRQVLIMERVFDPTIESLTHCPVSVRGLNLLAWKHRIEEACFEAGRWLRRWHGHDHEQADIGELLGRYIEGRSDQLDGLERTDRQTLLNLIANLGRGPICAVHGDFTPRNVLWSPAQLTVLDFGIGEWTKGMTPAWDFNTMQIGIASELRFATRSPARWIEPLGRASLRAFDQGYGEVQCERATLDACRAVRHLGLYTADIKNGLAVRKRADWHLAATREITQRYR